jgi:mevalonate kinase
MSLDVAASEAASAAKAVATAAQVLGLPDEGFRLSVRSEIPIGCGLGSSAAFAVAVVRALLGSHGQAAPAARVSEVAYELEKLAHATPSGVDNTVIAFEEAVRFERGAPVTPLRQGAPFSFVIADSGLRASTAEAVAGVRSYRQANPEVWAVLEEQAKSCVSLGIQALQAGDAEGMALAMQRNHALLREVGVSSPPLEALVHAAVGAGALAAKVTGAGVGGSILALVPLAQQVAVVQALENAGAAMAFATRT